MGESSSKSASSSHSAVSTFPSETSKVSGLSLSASSTTQQHILSTIPCVKNQSKVKLTLQDYRKQVGIRVLNLKPNQKLGISVKSESTVEKQNQPAPVKSTALCPHCGNPTGSINKCTRCLRALEKVKNFQLPSSIPTDESIPTGILQMSKEPLNYGTRRPRVRNSLLSRQTREKFEEPQCVTLSSDEEDSSQDSKKLKCEDNSQRKLELVSSSSLRDPQKSSIVEGESSNNCEMKSVIEHETKESNDLLRWKEGGLSGPFFAVPCRSVRMGSYKFCPVGRALFSSEGVMLEAPVLDSSKVQSPDSQLISVVILAEQLLQVEVHFNRQLPVIFLYVTPAVSRKFSLKLGLHKNGPFWDSASLDESHKRLTLLPCSLDDSAKNAIKQAFVPRGVFHEINIAQANRLLLMSSTPDVREAIDSLPVTTTVLTGPTDSPKMCTALKENSCKIEKKRQTRGMTKSSICQLPLPVMPMFSWSDGQDRFSVTTEDYSCLNQDNLLNDSIIDFYVRYIFSTELNDSVKNKCHVFSSFFYQRLTTRPPKVVGRKHPIEDDPSLTLKEKRHSRVKSWTKKVDIFEKDYLVIPINERAHWFLAIVCFPGLPGPVSTRTGMSVKLDPLKRLSKKITSTSINKVITVGGESFHIGNTTITPVNSNQKVSHNNPVAFNIDTDRDEAETDEDDSLDVNDTIDKDVDVMEPVKLPCILFFDSLAGSNHKRVAATLREYLMVEYQKRRKPIEDISSSTKDHATNVNELFSKETMVSACLEVPQQNNSYDCGIYVLQYAESFMKRPFTDYNLRNLHLASWFSSSVAGNKRKSIQFLLIRLTKERNPQAETVLDFLSKDDVRMALSEQSDTCLPSVDSRDNLISNTVVIRTKANGKDISETTQAVSQFLLGSS